MNVNSWGGIAVFWVNGGFWVWGAGGVRDFVVMMSGREYETGSLWCWCVVVGLSLGVLVVGELI